ncbi:hypothetical protein BGW41_001861 [Actinomortierella wolfii]|nr:hypothetical protein BGW41_001861 [Actinomortierella wolfii]
MTDHSDKHNHTTHFTNKYNLRDTPYDLRESTLESTIASERQELNAAHQHHSQYHAKGSHKQGGHSDSAPHAHTEHQKGGSTDDHAHHFHMSKEEEKLPPVQLATGNELNIEHPVGPEHQCSLSKSR